MIFVERSAEEPDSLSSAATVQQQQDAANYYATWSPGDAGFGGFDRYKQNDIKVELKRIFHQKCAYCEKKLEKGFFEVGALSAEVGGARQFVSRILVVSSQMEQPASCVSRL